MQQSVCMVAICTVLICPSSGWPRSLKPNVLALCLSLRCPGPARRSTALAQWLPAIQPAICDQLLDWPVRLPFCGVQARLPLVGSKLLGNHRPPDHCSVWLLSLVCLQNFIRTINRLHHQIQYHHFAAARILDEPPIHLGRQIYTTTVDTPIFATEFFYFNPSLRSRQDGCR
ncbi:hypothetical protein B0H65DRAFT_132443 [Neurospora tetraspora]|uniref:Secreted protein n=1 Tax=Neurospora tetraspora TaxID=94610 RepID=A0AAE0JL50_9PEZI|nr:hypothetical protein B0H65DRAFT_132443 [Neurospora tetraspora]